MIRGYFPIPRIPCKVSLAVLEEHTNRFWGLHVNIFGGCHAADHRRVALEACGSTIWSPSRTEGAAAQ